MREVKMFLCETCNNSYSSMEHATRCEANHAHLNDLEITDIMEQVDNVPRTLAVFNKRTKQVLVYTLDRLIK